MKKKHKITIKSEKKKDNKKGGKKNLNTSKEETNKTDTKRS